MSPALNISLALQHFEHSNAVKLCNGIMFDFYLRLSYIQLKLQNPVAMWNQDVGNLTCHQFPIPLLKEAK